MTREAIFAEAMKLEPKEREKLAEDLWQQSLATELSSEQRAELHRRIESLARGQTASIPGEQVMDELRHRFPQR